MSSPALVTRSQPITAQQMLDLATYANSKTTLSGQPYDFSPTDLLADKWLPELIRLRTNCIPNPSTTVITAPVGEFDYLDYVPTKLFGTDKWPVRAVSAFPLTDNIYQSNQNSFTVRSKAASGDAFFSYTHTTRRQDFTWRRGLEYLFPEPTLSGDKTVTTTATVGRTDITLPDGFDSEVSNWYLSQDELWWKHDISTSKDGRVSGRLIIAAISASVGGLDPIPPEMTLLGDLVGVGTVTTIGYHVTTTNAYQTNLIVEFDIPWTTTDLHLDIGVSLDNHNYTPSLGSDVEVVFYKGESGNPFHLWDTPPDNGVPSGTTAPGSAVAMEFYLVNETEDEAADLIHPDKECYRITVPDVSITHRDNYRRLTHASGKWDEVSGNQCTIAHTPSTDIKSIGTWLGQCMAMKSFTANPKTTLGEAYLNPKASVGAGAPAVIPAVDFVIPCYPAFYLGDQVSGAETNIPAGSVIWRAWFGQRDGLETDETIYVGFMYDGAFKLLDSVAIGESKSIEILPHWVVLKGTPLVYYTESGNPVDVQANIVTAVTTIEDTGGLTTNVAYPIFAEHYNETVAALDLIG